MNTDDTMMNKPVSRRTLLKTAGVAGLGITLAQAGFLRSAAAQSESVQDILNITATVESFGVTFLGVGLDAAKNGRFTKPWSDDEIAIVTAARAQEQFHLDFFLQAGGKQLTTTFTVPDPRILTDRDLFFQAVVDQETVEVAAQLAALRTFTELKRPDLVKVSFQYAAEEAEHRLVANYARGARPANNIAFAPALFSTTGQLLENMRQRGLIGGNGQAATFPGPGAIDPTNVTERTPGGREVGCVAVPLPPTGVGGSPIFFPETGYSLEGEFLDYWQSYGGLAVFGYPITSQQPINGQIVQWLERGRFEAHPQKAVPYNVLLGRLGIEALQRQGRDWRSFPKADTGQSHYFRETGHAITHAPFWNYWSGHGLEFDGQRGTSFAESLALFGYPVSEAQTETNANGDRVLTQWFERARFEYHPAKPEQHRVLLGRLGAELRGEQGR